MYQMEDNDHTIVIQALQALDNTARSFQDALDIQNAFADLRDVSVITEMQFLSVRWAIYGACLHGHYIATLPSKPLN